MAARGRPRDNAARERIVAAATDLFVRDGYVATTIGMIAQQARVAVKTIYSAYTNKLGVLSAVHDTSVAGGSEPLPLLEHEWVHAVAAAESVQAGWERAATELAVSTARAAPVLAVIHAAAADPEVARLLSDLRRQRLQFSRGMARVLAGLPGAAPDRVERVADVLYAVLSCESYTLFVTERGWALELWRDWAHGVVLTEL
ncbi:MAG: TetR/AcrR family transcriptional regulator [Brachybacterium sp.]|nr:TetR/AcrR family transcriptional regulator [Brachybacterium sp.]